MSKVERIMNALRQELTDEQRTIMLAMILDTVFTEKQALAKIRRLSEAATKGGDAGE